MANKKLLLAAGTGFLGQSAALYFKDKGYDITILTRGSEKIKDGIRYVNWDGKTTGAWTKYIDESYALINFAGKSVNCIYTDANKKEIIDSRIDSVRVLTEAILQSASPPAVFIQAASLAIYGDTTALCDENAPLGTGFSAEVCKRWEAEFNKTALPKTRKVLFRIGFALGKNGGALEPLAKLTKLFLGGTIGSGRQYISWFHIEDLNRMFEFALDNKNIEGTYNATGIAPVTNADFMRTLRKVLHMPWSPLVPSFAVRIGAYLFMQADASLALTGRKCIPKKLQDAGFRIKHDDLEKTLKELTS